MTYGQLSNKLRSNGYRVRERLLVNAVEPDEIIGLEVHGVSPLWKDEEAEKLRKLIPFTRIHWLPNEGYFLIEIK